MSAAPPTLAFVIPWYGPDIPGGAETATRLTAEQLAAAGWRVEIATTCIRDIYADWGKNHHRPGVSTLNGVTVRRFPVIKRDREAFDMLNRRLMNGLSIPPEAEETFINEMFRSPELLEFIRARHTDYLYFFTPYMFASTYFGAGIHPERTAIIPCLHDEPYAHLGIYRPVLRSVRALLFYAPAEAALTHRLIGDVDGQFRDVVGLGVTPPAEADGARFRRKYGVDVPFMLYAGRREPGKNTPLLLDYWYRFQSASGHDVRLVLIGPGSVTLPDGDGTIIDLGYVPVQDKHDAYAAADIICQPSVHESFSLVIMEGWLAATPALVHSRCAVTRDHVTRSNGGLYFGNADEFGATAAYLFENRRAAAQMGRQGRRYVEEYYRWPLVLQRFERAIAELDR